MKKFISIMVVFVLITGMAFAQGQEEKATQNVTLTFSNGSLSTSLDGQAMQKMVDYCKEQSGGSIIVDPHWQNSLFTQNQEIPSLIKGNLDMCQAQPSQLATYFPKMYTLTATYIFKDYNHWKKFYDSPTAQAIFDEMEKELGIVVLAVENFGARTISLAIDKKITSRNDMKGIKLRTMSDESSLFMGEALGANAFPIPYPDVYMSLQTGTIDGQENVIKTIIDNSYYEVLKSVTLNRHVQGTNFYIINAKKWHSLSKEQQAIVKKGAEICADYKTSESLKEDEICAAMEAKGMKVYKLTDEELTNYRNEVVDYYFAHPEVTKLWDMDLYNAIQALDK